MHRTTALTVTPLPQSKTNDCAVVLCIHVSITELLLVFGCSYNNIYVCYLYNVEEKNTHADLPWEASGAFLVTTLYTYSTQPAHLTCI